jgi:hypothetical protein
MSMLNKYTFFQCSSANHIDLAVAISMRKESDRRSHSRSNVRCREYIKQPACVQNKLEDEQEKCCAASASEHQHGL